MKSTIQKTISMTCLLLTGGWVLTPARPLAQTAETPPADAAAAPRKRRQPPPAVIPTEETLAAQKQFQSGRYDAAVAQAKAALAKNERYTPAMLIMAKSFYKLGKYEWVRTLNETMEKNSASPAEKAEILQILAFLEIEKENHPGAIELLKRATAERPENAVLWNNLGGMYLTAKNFREAVPALERATQLQPSFSKAFLNLGSAYRGLKEYPRAQAAYERALQLFPNYADAVFNLGILYLDAEKVQSMDLTAQMNASIGYLQRYKQMLGGRVVQGDPADVYITEAHDKIDKEQKRIERERKRLEREAKRGAQKEAAQNDPANPPADVPAPPAQ
jgi:tetratricopeptide (TPR) repeat protein